VDGMELPRASINFDAAVLKIRKWEKVLEAMHRYYLFISSVYV
jgi:hypothetical protein